MNAANGFVDPPASSSYAPDFVARYRAGQRARVERLDALARSMIAERMASRDRAKAGGARADRIEGSLQRIITIWRTDADLRCWDLSLEPSDRKYGSLWGSDPFASNLGSVGFARLCTPESWLSTWSGLSSNASLELAAPSIEQPVLIASYTGDVAVFASDLAAITRAIPASDKTVEAFRGDHHGQALVKGETAGRDLAGRQIGKWLRERFPAISETGSGV